MSDLVTLARVISRRPDNKAITRPVHVRPEAINVIEPGRQDGETLIRVDGYGLLVLAPIDEMIAIAEGAPDLEAVPA